MNDETDTTHASGRGAPMARRTTRSSRDRPKLCSSSTTPARLARRDIDPATARRRAGRRHTFGELAGPLREAVLGLRDARPVALAGLAPVRPVARADAARACAR